MDQTSTKITKEFQAETKQLLDLMVHSIYTNREIFLRELISNASDAIDKLHFQSLTNLDLLEGDSDFAIWLEIDEANHTLSITDNGLGMNYDEVIEDIGTIAKSGTKAFIEKLQSQEGSQNPELIGQFGVGFYSAFMVSDKVTLLTKTPGANGVRWESTGDGTYTIEPAEHSKRGTTVILTLNEAYRNPEKPEENFLNRYTLQNLVKKYSDYIRYPIKLDFPKEERPKDKDGKEIEGAAPTITIETRTLNSMTPLWARNKSEITQEEYQQFYKNLFHDWNEAAEVIHTKVEGAVEYTALLFIPSTAPFDFYSKEYRGGTKLYSKHVFVMDNCEELLPDYLRFVRGLVDSPDFSLNISREILQQSQQLKLIGKNLEKTVLKTLESMLAKERPKYETFWKEFGSALKAGVYLDFQSHERLQDLLLFPSSNAIEGYTTLSEYLKRMPENQKEIYYITGKDRAAVEKLPQLESLRDKGFEVLYLFDRVDEFTIDSLHEYQKQPFKSVSRGDLALEGDEAAKEAKAKLEELTQKHEPMLKAIKEQLKDKVAEVRLTNRLKSSPVCLVSGDSGISLSMEQILAEMNQSMFKATRILEINPDHEVFNILERMYQADPQSNTFKEYNELLYGQSLLMEGITLENPVEFAAKIAELMIKAGKQ
ncbi:MAG TPA: molecular chaperone HtpG [Bacillota bacterium]